MPNGLIQIEDTSSELTSYYNLAKRSTQHKYISLVETSRIKYECQAGFRLRVQQPSQLDLKQPVLIEKCIRGVNQSQHVECVRTCRSLGLTAQVQADKANGFLVPVKSYFEPGQQVVYMCSEGYAAQIPVLVDNSNQSNQSETTNRYYSVRMSNVNSFECSPNGSWHLIIAKLDDTSSTLSLNEITRLPQCLSIKELMRDQQQETILTPDGLLEDVVVAGTVNGTTSDQMAYAELNIRSLLLMITVGGALIILLVLSALGLKIYHHRREESLLERQRRPRDCEQNQVSGSMLLYQSYLPQLMDHSNHNRQFYTDILAAATGGSTRQLIGSNQSGVDPAANVSSTPATHIQRSTPNTHSAANPSFNYSLLVNSNTASQLPSYDEAVRQSTSNSSIQALPNPASINIESTLQARTDAIDTTGLDLAGFLTSTQIIRSNPQCSSTTDNQTTLDSPDSRPFVKSETESVAAVAAATANQLISSLNGSIRSNITIRSSTPSMRTNHSIGTSSSICNHQRKLSASSASRKTTSNSRHNRHNRPSNRSNLNHQPQTSLSFRSNRSDASQVALKGSTMTNESSSLSNQASNVNTESTGSDCFFSTINSERAAAAEASSSYSNDEDTEQLLRPNETCSSSESNKASE